MLFRRAVTLVTFGLGALLTQAAPAQSVAAELPAGWNNLGPEEFVEAYRLAETAQPLSAEQQKAACQRAVELLTQEGEAISFYAMNRLRIIAEPELTKGQKADLRERLLGPSGSLPDNASFAELHNWGRLRNESAVATDCNQALDVCETVARWVERSPGLVAKNPLGYPGIWLLRNLSASSYLQRQSLKAFTVSWEGQVVSPRTGDFTFSPAAFDISTEFWESGKHCKFEQSMSVWIEGKQVLDATAEDWSREGTPVRLAGGTPTPIRIEYRYTTTIGKVGEAKLALAILSWEGPGLSRSVVPPQAFKTPDGSQPGLLAHYHVTLADEEVDQSVVEPNVEHVWRSGERLLSTTPSAEKLVVDAIWREAMDPEYWASLEDQQLHRFLAVPRLANYLTCQQRAAFLKELVGHPRQMAQLTRSQATRVFDAYQYGAEQQANEFLGACFQEHQLDTAPAIDADFMRTNRTPYRLLTIPMLWQHPMHLEEFEAYLETDQGECCLPVAYVLAYGHLKQGDIRSWIDLLEERLAAKTLQGDRRVNWLIARAMAEEICKCSSSRHTVVPERQLAGLPWLDEAMLVAESEGARNRLMQERVARYASYQLWDEAREAANSQPALLGQLDKLEDEHRGRLKLEEAAAMEAYVNELRRRAHAATERGDSVVADRYTAQIERVAPDID